MYIAGNNEHFKIQHALYALTFSSSWPTIGNYETYNSNLFLFVFVHNNGVTKDIDVSSN